MAKKDPKPTDKADAAQALFGFAGFVVSKILFQELPKLPLAEGEELSNQLTTNVSLGYGISENREQAEVRFGLTAAPDPRDKPYQLEVEVVGQFVQKSGPPEKFEEFCRSAAPMILFPYVREVVNRITHDARYGPIRLDPMNLQTLIKKDGWQNANKVATDASTEPPPQPPQ